MTYKDLTLVLASINNGIEGGKVTKKKLRINKDGYCVKGVWDELKKCDAHRIGYRLDYKIKQEGMDRMRPIKDQIQKDYIDAKRNFDNAVKEAEEYLCQTLKGMGVEITKSPWQADCGISMEVTAKYDLEHLASILRDNERRLLRWGCEYLLREEMAVEKEQLLECFYDLEVT